MGDRHAVVWLLLAAVSLAPPAVAHAQARDPDPSSLTACDAPDADPWVTRLRDRVLEFDLLARTAIRLHGAPIVCEGKVTTLFDGNAFGVLRLGFEGGASFEVETQPPETSIAVLRDPAGLADEDAARRALEAYCEDVGVEIDWTDAETRTDGEERTVTYRDPDEGLNASASLVYRGGTLIALRFSLAL